MGLQMPGQRPNRNTQFTTAQWQIDDKNNNHMQETTIYPTYAENFPSYTCRVLQGDKTEMEIFCNDAKSTADISTHLPFNEHTFHCLLDTYDIERLSANYACKLNERLFNTNATATNAIDCMMETNMIIKQLEKAPVTRFKVFLAQAAQEIIQQSDMHLEEEGSGENTSLSTLTTNMSLECGKQMLICDMAANSNATTAAAIQLFKHTPVHTKNNQFKTDANLYEPSTDTETVLEQIFCYIRKEITNMTSLHNDNGKLVTTLDTDWLPWPGNNYDDLYDHLSGNSTNDEVWNWNSLFNISTENVEQMLNSTLKDVNVSVGLEQHVDYINVRQHDYDWIFLFVFIFIFAGGLGNILVCLAVALDRKLQNVTNYFLFSLAIADLLVSLFVMPLGAIPAFLGKLSVSNYVNLTQTKEYNFYLILSHIHHNTSQLALPKQ